MCEYFPWFVGYQLVITKTTRIFSLCRLNLSFILIYLQNHIIFFILLMGCLYMYVPILFLMIPYLIHLSIKIVRWCAAYDRSA